MTAQELRIGNYVFLSDKDGNKRPFQMESFDIYKVDESDCYDISPIPLTPEVLEACDLSREPFKSHLYKNSIRDGSGNYDGYCLVLKYSKDIVYIPCNIKLLSLHQLQNLYYAITGQELTIDIDKLKNAVK